ncbi:cereblon family protein [Leptospira sarikeiensis]|uniref:CULT domain-containing protein n=1 Tax=Leptospira sarikeiensis TaxID=2484943 RepID=A0A4R9KDZ1_9LEPT|nr:cereblon family protein [Leptospira sarikeiensis]TGL63403.1 hypothetical protein EHQ64_05455 [Leptospira sarikeiensis]
MQEIPQSPQTIKFSQEIENKNENWKICLSCGEKITKEEWKTSVDGAYLHNFVNPLGIEFRILTFSQGIGISWQKNSYLEHTWFPGFAWRIGTCASCGNHLGWSFEFDSQTFLGLVVGQISA